MAAMRRRRHLLAAPIAALVLTGCVPELRGQKHDPDRGPSAPRGPALLRQAMLDAHARERAGVGLPPLAWSEGLAAEAKAYARSMAVTRRVAHSEQPAGRGRQGENLWTGVRGDYTYEEMVAHWAAERRYFVDAPSPDFSRTGRWEDAGHYSQIVWRATTRVGCALASNRTEDYLVCRYWPPGNGWHERPY